MITEEKTMLNEIKDFIATKKTLPNPESNLIAVLHKVQQLYCYLPKEVIDMIAVEMNIPTAHIWGVATFYHYFNLKKPGQYTIAICLGTACYVKGSSKILEAIKEHLKIDVGQVTEDGVFSIQPARCVGACGQAPVLMIDEKIYGELTPEKAIKIIESYRAQSKNDKK
mgnify:CR=1 FL=1